MWEIQDRNAFLISAFEEEEVFSYWLQSDAVLYGECLSELGVDVENAQVCDLSWIER